MNERKLAWEILNEVYLHHGYASLMLRKRLQGLTEQESSLVTQLVYGTLQNHRYVRYQWEDLSKTKPRGELCVLLDLSVYQLFFLDKVPSYAVISEMVELAKSVHHGHYSSFVNGILRNVQRRGKRALPSDSLEQLEITSGVPKWLLSMWKAHYGEAQMNQNAAHTLDVKEMSARVHLDKISMEEVLQTPGFSKGHLAKYAVRYDGNLTQHPFFQEGKITIQDEASQLVVETMDPQKGWKILDTCAAPGTKSIQMAQVCEQEVQITSLELHEHRAQLIRNACVKQGITCIDVRCMDATKVQDVYQAESFDAILVDAPCSGLGVLSQKPEIKLHITPNDIDAIVAVQAEILESCVSLLKEGGTLVYSTCTMNKKENENQMKKFLKNHEEMELLEERTIFPQQFHTDGFYIAKCRKMPK